MANIRGVGLVLISRTIAVSDELREELRDFSFVIASQRVARMRAR